MIIPIIFIPTQHATSASTDSPFPSQLRDLKALSPALSPTMAVSRLAHRTAAARGFGASAFRAPPRFAGAGRAARMLTSTPSNFSAVFEEREQFEDRHNGPSEDDVMKVQPAAAARPPARADAAATSHTRQRASTSD